MYDSTNAKHDKATIVFDSDLQLGLKLLVSAMHSFSFNGNSTFIIAYRKHLLKNNTNKKQQI